MLPHLSVMTSALLIFEPRMDHHHSGHTAPDAVGAAKARFERTRWIF